jgi:hypothetical protein
MIKLVLLLFLIVIAAETLWKPRLDFNTQTGDLLLWYNTPEGRGFKQLI